VAIAYNMVRFGEFTIEYTTLQLGDNETQQVTSEYGKQKVCTRSCAPLPVNIYRRHCTV
jgi:hypothetical protein